MNSIIPVNSLLEPAFRVEQVVLKKSHFYDVIKHGETAPALRFPGTTGFLSVINKPALIPWAKKEALSHVKGVLLNRLNGSQNGTLSLNAEGIETLIAEAHKRPDQIKDAAATHGTNVHAIIDNLIRGETVTYSEDYAPAVLAFQKWWKNSGIELVMGDTKVASLVHKYGGALDALGRRNGRFIILDWKTSNAIYDEYSLQVAAYAQAFSETFGIYCQEAIIVRFGKKLPIDFETKTVTDIDGAFKAFLHAKNLKESLEKIRLASEVAA